MAPLGAEASLDGAAKDGARQTLRRGVSLIRLRLRRACEEAAPI
jgi:hypothetical protein